jgi:hypothetical protein
MNLRMNARTADIVAQQMRVDVCTYLRSHKKRFEEFCDGGLENYITAMEKPGFFGGHLEAKILSEMSDSRLHILSVLREDGRCVVDDKNIMGDYHVNGGLLYISFFQHMFSENHYMATVSEGFHTCKQSSRRNPDVWTELGVTEAMDQYRKLFKL